MAVEATRVEAVEATEAAAVEGAVTVEALAEVATRTSHRSRSTP